MVPTCVAVVDDEAPVRVALGRLLRLADYDVAAFASGEEFLASLAVRVPDCVLLDLHMPGLSGLQVQARLQAGQFRLPVVLITASDDVEIERSAMRGGSVCVLRKPFSSQVLLDSLHDALRADRPAPPDPGAAGAAH